jgi:hypothetical protein
MRKRCVQLMLDVHELEQRLRIALDEVARVKKKNRLLRRQTRSNSHEVGGNQLIARLGRGDSADTSAIVDPLNGVDAEALGFHRFWLLLPFIPVRGLFRTGTGRDVAANARSSFCLTLMFTPSVVGIGFG